MTVKAGDFFYSSWGYDQTNVDFYKVIGITKTGKSVRVMDWSSKAPPNGRAVPGNAPRRPLVMTKRLHKMVASDNGLGRPSFTVNSYSNAYLHNPGDSHYVTPIGYGH